MSKTYEARTVDLFGPQLLIESGGAVGVAGQCAWKLSSIKLSSSKTSFHETFFQQIHSSSKTILPWKLSSISQNRSKTGVDGIKMEERF